MKDSPAFDGNFAQRVHSAETVFFVMSSSVYAFVGSKEETRGTRFTTRSFYLLSK